MAIFTASVPTQFQLKCTSVKVEIVGMLLTDASTAPGAVRDHGGFSTIFTEQIRSECWPGKAHHDKEMRMKGRDGGESTQAGRVQRNNLTGQQFLHSKAATAARSTGHTPHV